MEACAGSTWGAVAAGIQDAPSCVRGCREGLLQMLAPGNETYENLCSVLVQLEEPRRNDMLLGLYCCDSQLCGVDNIGRPGYDPNVNFLINVCQGLGFAPFHDPGPPAATSVCTNTILPSSDISCSRTTIFSTSSLSSEALVTATPSSPDASSSTSPTTSPTMSPTKLPIVSPTMSITSISTGTDLTSTTLPSITSLVDPRLKDNLSDNAASGGGLSKTARIIIATTVAIAVFVAAVAVLWHCRYRRKNRQDEAAGDEQPRLAFTPPQEQSSATSQIVSPAVSYFGPNGEPLTPPARLKERRLLPMRSSERLIGGQNGRLRSGFHLPTTASRTGISTPHSSMRSTGRQPSAPASPGRPNRSLLATPPRSQLPPIQDGPARTEPGLGPDRGLTGMTAESSSSAAASRATKPRISASPNAIGVALEFPPMDTSVQRQDSNTSGESSASKMMAGPLRRSWGDSWIASEDGDSLPKELPAS